MIRKRAKRLMEHGVTQKAIAASMGMSTATFSRWVNDDENVKITTDALDGFYEYEHTLRVLLGPEPDHAHQVRDPAIRKRESSEETALKKRARST